MAPETDPRTQSTDVEPFLENNRARDTDAMKILSVFNPETGAVAYEVRLFSRGGGCPKLALVGTRIHHRRRVMLAVESWRPTNLHFTLLFTFAERDTRARLVSWGSLSGQLEFGLRGLVLHAT